MALPKARILREGKTHYAWEREAIEFVKQCLPNREPYYLLALFEVPDGSTSRLYEIDLLVIDGEVTSNDASGQLRLKNEKINLVLDELQGFPVVLMGGQGAFVSDDLKLKTSWASG